MWKGWPRLREVRGKVVSITNNYSQSGLLAGISGEIRWGIYDVNNFQFKDIRESDLTIIAKFKNFRDLSKQLYSISEGKKANQYCTNFLRVKILILYL